MAEEPSEEPASSTGPPATEPTSPETNTERCYKYFCITTPVAVYFLLINRMLENFAAYGIIAVIMIYLKEELLLPQHLAKFIFHVSQFAVICFPVIGAVLADFYVGKFWVIVPLDWIWMIVFGILSVTSYSPLGISPAQQRDAAIACLVLSKFRGLATPSVVAFPGDQYDPTATKARDQFYYALYFAINFGAMFAHIIVPRFRADIHCIPDSENCFPAAFGIPVLVSLLATVFLFSGVPFYKLLPPERKQNWSLVKCFGHGVARRARSGWRHTRRHWLDLADDKYSEKDIADVKAILSVIVLFTVYPMFFALFDQQPSLWTMMSTKLDGRSIFGQILPDQMDAANPAIVMALIPIFTAVIYPACKKIYFLRTPLERIGYGFAVAGLSYLLGGFLCLVVENNMPAYPAEGKTDIALHNGLPCDVNVELNQTSVKLSSYESVQLTDMDVSKEGNLSGNVKLDYEKCKLGRIPSASFSFFASGRQAYSMAFSLSSDRIIYQVAMQNRSRDNQINAAKVRFIYIGSGVKNRTIVFDSPALKVCYPLNDTFRTSNKYGSANTLNHETKLCYLPISKNKDEKMDEYCRCKHPFATYIFARGGIYDMMIIEHDEEHTDISVFATAEPDAVPILLQLPMYLLITAGEIMCSVTAYSFAYSESPAGTKSIMQSVYYVSHSLGNLIVLIVDMVLQAISDEVRPQDKERPTEIPAASTVFFVYFVLMVLNVLYFIFLARRYTYVNPEYKAMKQK